MPNNGTLRLPLSPIGLHDPDSEGSGVETPPDPVDVSTYSSSHAVSPSSSSPAPALEASSSAVSEPTPESSSAATSTTTSPVSTTTSSAIELPPAPTGDIGDEDDGDENFSETHSFWDWLTDKISGVWDKITGSDSDS